MLALECSQAAVKILVVDDHPENILALRAVLNRADYDVVHALSGAEALKKILKHDFAVILMDVMMPEMDGFDTAQMIRQREISRDIPIIFLTATEGETRFLYKGYAVGAVDYLIKPVDPDIVRAKVAVFVDLFRRTERVKQQEESLRRAQQRSSEEALRQSEEQYEATFNQAAVGIAHLDAQNRFVLVNSRLCSIFGCSRDDLLGTNLEDRAADKDSGPSLGGCRQFVRKDGLRVWLDLRLSTLCPSAGKSQRHLICVVEDVTGHRRNEDRQRLLAEAGETLMHTLASPSALQDVVDLVVPRLADWCMVHVQGAEFTDNFVVSHVNPAKVATLRLLSQQCGSTDAGGMGMVSVTGQPELIFPNTWVDLENKGPTMQMRGLLQEMGCASAMIVPLKGAHEICGTLTFGAGVGQPPYDSQDLAMAQELAHRIVVALDNARLHTQLQAAVSLRDEFMCIASHELRTPLTPLVLQFERLLSKRAKTALQDIPPERLRSILQRSERQVQRLVLLVESLLDVSRICSGRMQLQYERVSLGEVVQEIAARHQEDLVRTESTLTVHVEEDVVGHWDRLRIEQVVTNLLNNAVKYGAGKPISLRVRRDTDGASFCIEDSGIGIAPDKISGIFGRFERAVSSRVYGGLGLGLYIVRQILDAHGGTIQVFSEQGVGSRFTVVLPLQIPASAPVSPANTLL